MSLVELPPDPDEQRGLSKAIKRVLLLSDVPFIDELLNGVVLIALMVLVLPLAAVVFIATSLLFYGVLMLLGVPSGTLGAVLGLIWFGGSLSLIGWLCVLGWRRLAFFRVLTGLASPSPEEEPALTNSSSQGDPNADPDTVLTRVADADASLAGAPEDQGGDRTYQ